MSMKTPIFDMQGKEVGSLELPEKLFGVKPNDTLLHQVVTAMQANARVVLAHTKGRGEVRGGGKKPWKQKGTGRARHGSIRSPIWRGGGTTHGPRKEEKYSQKINQKMRARALALSLSAKAQNGRLILVQDLSFTAPKTKHAKAALVAIGKGAGVPEVAARRMNAALIALPTRSHVVEKSFQNLGNVSVIETRNLNPVTVLAYRYLILVHPEEAVQTLFARFK